MSESKAEIIRKTVGNGANYVEFPCSREDVTGLLTAWVCKAQAELDAVEPTPTPSIVAPNYHPDYGYPNYYRVWAIECAQVCGVSFAANAYNVGQSTIYKWMAASKLNQTGNTANN